MADFDKIVADLKQTRDEVKLKIHLGNKDLQDEWQVLEAKWAEFERDAKLSESAEGISDELADAYRKIKAAL
ncbi:MAG: hypothetical protein ABJP66_08090 [Hyphomicrobiales bacterium]